MNGKKAKKLRKMVYGDSDIRRRGYGKKKEQIIADPMRQIYQKIKKAMK